MGNKNVLGYLNCRYQPLAGVLLNEGHRQLIVAAETDNKSAKWLLI